MRLEFFLPMAKVPTATHQEQGVRVVKGKPVFYDTPEVKAARAKLTAHLAKHAPEKPLRGAVRLLVKWCFLRGDSHRNGEYRTSRPDTDNLQKLLKDCMTKCGFWKDDAQVASEICEKFWADLPGLYIRVEELAADGRSQSADTRSNFEALMACPTPEALCVALNANERRFCPKAYTGKPDECQKPCGQCITDWLREDESRTSPVVREVNSCLGCDCWDGDAEGCTMPPEDKAFACTLESEADKLCGNCRWYAEFEGVCTNGESEYRADFRESGDTCPQWES